MAYIKVDYASFDGAIEAVEQYIRELETKMARASVEKDGLLARWQGADAKQFEMQWSGVQAEGSAYSELKKALTSYEQYLRYARERYRKTQEGAIVRAGRC